MAKALDGALRGGPARASWLKIKARTRSTWWCWRPSGAAAAARAGSATCTSARATRDGGFVMLGKTFKGLTDEMLAWQTEALARARDRARAYVVHVRPELVVEIAFNDVQAEPALPGRRGAALRARASATAPTRARSEADTIDSGAGAVRPVRCGGAPHRMNRCLSVAAGESNALTHAESVNSQPQSEPAREEPFETRSPDSRPPEPPGQTQPPAEPMTPKARGKRNRGPLTLRFLGCSLMMVASLFMVIWNLQEGSLQNANTGSRYATIQALIDYGTYHIDKSQYVHTIDKYKVGDNYISSKPPTLPTIGAGIYWVYRELHRQDHRWL